MCYSNLSKSVYKIFSLSILLYLLFLLYSCSKEDGINLPYLGGLNTSREYEITTWRFEANTSIPYIKLEDTVYKHLSFDSAQISEGVVGKSHFTETLISYDTSYQILSDPDLASNSFMKREMGEQYDLAIELECILNNRKYSNRHINQIDALSWFENGRKLSTFYHDGENIILKKPLSTGDEWIRDSYTYVTDNRTLETFQVECKVIDWTEVDITAGNFMAYKIEITHHWVDLNYKSIWGYEYYVSNVGLILEESDNILYETIIPLVGQGEPSTSCFRQKQRKELINYNFIK